MTFGNTKEVLDAKRVLLEGQTEISERAYNLIIGAVLMWGFLLNIITIKAFGDGIMSYVYRNGPTAIYVFYLISAIIGVFMVSSPSALASFIGYNLIAVPVGLLLCIALDGIDYEIISDAVICTAAITGAFIVLSTIWPGFFLSMGRALCSSLLILIIGDLVFWLIGADDMMFCWLGAGIFGVYISYDWARCSVCACTVDNAVDAAANLYLDIINLFLRILRIMARSKRRD